MFRTFIFGRVLSVSARPNVKSIKIWGRETPTLKVGGEALPRRVVGLSNRESVRPNGTWCTLQYIMSTLHLLVFVLFVKV